MTKKDFIPLASGLLSNVPNVNSNTYEAQSLLFESIVTSIMDVCQNANPRFDRARFASACGLDEVRKSRELAQAA
jgi:hypothetical protein